MSDIKIKTIGAVENIDAVRAVYECMAKFCWEYTNIKDKPIDIFRAIDREIITLHVTDKSTIKKSIWTVQMKRTTNKAA